MNRMSNLVACCFVAAAACGFVFAQQADVPPELDLPFPTEDPEPSLQHVDRELTEAEEESLDLITGKSDLGSGIWGCLSFALEMTRSPWRTGPSSTCASVRTSKSGRGRTCRKPGRS